MKFLEGEREKVLFESAKWKAHTKTGVKTATIGLSMEVTSKSQGLPKPLINLIWVMENDADATDISTAFTVENRNLFFRSAPDLKRPTEEFRAILLEGFEVVRDRNMALFLKFEFTVRLEEAGAAWMWNAFGNHIWLDSEECQKELIPLGEEEPDPRGPPSLPEKKSKKGKDQVN